MDAQPTKLATPDPAAYFAELAAHHPRCFWLDGGGARGWSGNRSMIGKLDDQEVSLTFHAAAGEVRRHQGGVSTVIGDDVFAALAAELAQGDAGDHWVGYFGYAARPDLAARPDPELPDAVWMHTRSLQFFNHPQTPPRLASTSTDASQGTETPNGARNRLPRGASAYRKAFAQVQERLHAGDSYEVNLTFRDQLASDLDPVSAYLRLREVNPAPYAGYLQHDVAGARAWLLSSSPERYAVIDADRILETKPIKGTVSRSADPARDEAMRELLATHPKFRAENLMIVDLLRNDLSMVCEPGTVTVPSLMAVESYTSVHQLVSTVRGRLRDGVSSMAALHALFPAGSMTGAPKRRTMEIIDSVETSPRGAYAGAFGWICADGRADLGVVIRSLTTVGDGSYRFGTGGGITVDSECGDEYAEAALKAERLRAALRPEANDTSDV